MRIASYGHVLRLDVDHIDNPQRFQGRYLSLDPIGLAGGVNGYLYGVNPTGWVDPLGLAACCPEEGWTFNPNKDLDYRDLPGNPYEQVRKALDEAFRRTGVPRSEFKVTKWGGKYGKSHPTEWSVKSGAYRGAEVNIDDPELVPSAEGPKIPHVGYQTAGKRPRAGGVRGHILVQRVHVSGGKISTEKGR